MKKTFLLVFITTLVVSGWSYGQSVETRRFQLNDTIVRTIVRELEYPATIAYVETTTKHFFVYNDGSLTLTAVPINSKYSVNDFVIEDAFVYFCGTNYAGEGIFGEFGWHDYFFGSHAYNITDQQMYSLTNSLVTELNEMVAYGLNNAIEMVAVGKTSAGMDCVVELQHTISGYNYRVGELDANSADNILDITLTSDRVVTAGFRTYGNHSFPCVRTYDKSDVFSATGPQSTSLGFYYNYPNVYSFDNTQLKLSPVMGTTLYASVYWREYDFSTYTLSPNRGVGIAKLNISSLNTPEVEILQTLLLPQPYNSGLWEIKGLTCMASTVNYPFYLLQEAEVDQLTQSVSMVTDLHLSDFSSPTASILPIIYIPDATYHSIDGYNNNMQYITSGVSLLDNTYLKYSEGNTGNYLCAKDTSFACNNTTNITKRHILEPLLETGYIPMTLISLTGRMETFYGSIECPTKELRQVGGDEQ